MKKIIRKISMFLISPRLVGKMTDGGKKVRVNFRNVTAEDTMLILFTIVGESAKALGMDRRQLMNKVIDLDKTILAAAKRVNKAQRHESYLNKNR